MVQVSDPVFGERRLVLLWHGRTSPRGLRARLLLTRFLLTGRREDR